MPSHVTHKSARSRAGIFISYARGDGSTFAKNLRRRLSEEYHFQVWQDIVELEGGKDWWLQIEAAIKSVEFLVMVMTPGALRSEITRKEWRLARQEGVCVLPVMAGEIDFTTLPRWMRETHFFDFKFPEQWNRFIRTLQTPCQAPRVPFMVEDLPEDFVQRPDEFDQLLALLLDPKHEEPIAITAALRGAGGYGKTTLAKALCHDERIQNVFDDGVLWVTLGENPGDLTGRVEDLIYTLSGERPGFSSVQAAAARFAELLVDRDILLVIDDVWNGAHLTPFLQGGSRCARLITTRNSDTLPAKAKGIDLDAMRPDEATSLLGFNLPEGENSGLQRLAQRLGEWPLLLKLVNATLRYRVHDLQQSLAAAIAFVNAALEECGLIAFDQDNATERHQAVAKTLEVGLQMLAEGERQRYFELAIFPEDVNIPLATLEKLWSAAGYKPIHTEKLCEKLHKLSLLLHFDLNDSTIRLHDVMRKYLVQKIGDDLPKLHDRFLDTYFPSPHANWVDLPSDEPYLWRYLAYHLNNSNQVETLQNLLFDYDWLANKLAVCEVNALLADYDSFPEDRELRLVQSALRLSANQLTSDRQQLTSHLFGRLTGQDSLGVRSLLQDAKKKAKRPWLRPLTPSLATPGGPLLRTLEGHNDFVSAVATTPNGKYAVSASADKTLKVWDLASGQALQTLKGHLDSVTGVAISPDGKNALSTSRDKTLKVWDLASGQALRTLKGHNGPVNSVAITPDGKHAVSASDDHTLKVWNLTSGQALRTLKGHNGPINSVAVSPEGKHAVSASEDKTLKVWDLVSGRALRTLIGHNGSINSVAVSPEGKYAVSASEDKTLRVWDLTLGQTLQILKGGSVNAVVITSDGRRAVSASNDSTLKVWDLVSGQALQTLKGHNDPVYSVALISYGKCAVSASEDQTLKVWDLTSTQALQTLEEHSSEVNSVAIAPDGKHVVSASDDHTLKVWNLASGQLLRTLEGHNGSVEDVAITPDGKCAVSVSRDDTLKVWDLAFGQVMRTLEWPEVASVAVTLDGKHAVSTSWLETLEIWDMASGEMVQLLNTHYGPVISVAITPDGNCAVSVSKDGTLEVWDLASGQALRRWEGHNESINSVAITPDGKHVVSASDDHTLKVWDLASGHLLRTLEGHNGWVNDVAITPDGEQAVSASSDHKIKVWELATEKAITTFWGESRMKCCAVAPDGRTIVAGDDYGRVHFLRLEGLEA